MIKRFVPVLIFCIAALISVAQKPYSVKSKRAIRAYEKATELLQVRDNENALVQLGKALEMEPDFVEGWLLQADIFHQMKKADQEIKCYFRAIDIDPDFFPNVHFNLANVLLRRGEYSTALESYERFLKYKNISSRNRNLANKNIKNCHFALNAIKHPVPFNPINMGDSINTQYDEYWPSLTADEKILIFTSLVPRDRDLPFGDDNRQEDFFQSEKSSDSWSKAIPMDKPLNTISNEGAQSLTADGRFMYFTACGRAGGKGRCDIYFSQKKGDSWSAPVNIGPPVNTSSWEAQPSISADGRTLYFVSNRKGGKGKMDIWMCHLLERRADGSQRWSKPQNLPFNTPGDEMSPFIHAGNSSLYLASDGYTGMGGLDLFRVDKTVSHSWGKPKNLGYPVNTYGDESGVIINARGDCAYFASDRVKGKGRDLYSFTLAENDKPLPVSFLKGQITDNITHMPLHARLLLVDLAEADTVAILHSDPVTGNYLVCLPLGNNYAFNVEAERYLFHSEHFSLVQSRDALNPKYMNIGLKPISNGQTVILNNVFFDTDSWILKSESTVELDKLVLFLNKEDEIHIEIGGHTDSSGTKEHNIKLSHMRAKAVFDYLVKNGISNLRLNYKGYGDSHPIGSNDSDKGRASNRRTEFKIVK